MTAGAVSGSIKLGQNPAGNAIPGDLAVEWHKLPDHRLTSLAEYFRAGLMGQGCQNSRATVPRFDWIAVLAVNIVDVVFVSAITNAGQLDKPLIAIVKVLALIVPIQRVRPGARLWRLS